MLVLLDGRTHLGLDLLQVEVVAPPGDEAVGVELDHGAPVHLDPGRAAQGAAPDPFEGAAAAVTVRGGDLLLPVCLLYTSDAADE